MDDSGNKTVDSAFLDVLMALKGNIMRDCNVAEIGEINRIDGDVYDVISINNESVKYKCIALQGLSLNMHDIVLVVFTNTNYKLNLNRIGNNQLTQNIESNELHSVNNGVVIGIIKGGTNATE